MSTHLNRTHRGWRAVSEFPFDDKLLRITTWKSFSGSLVTMMTGHRIVNGIVKHIPSYDLSKRLGRTENVEPSEANVERLHSEQLARHHILINEAKAFYRARQRNMETA